ncbi:MAG: hypothetical protein R3B81_00315 [bacterium]
MGTPALGLQVQRIQPRLDDPWRDGPPVTLSYYNLCTGWVWHWNHLEFREGEVVGTTLEVPSGYDALVGQWTYLAYGLAGRGFCVCSVASVDGGVADSLLATTYFVPEAGWNFINWDVPVSGEISVWVEGPYIDYLGGVVTENPGFGPDGSGPACGTCYPIGRPTRSRYSFGGYPPPQGAEFQDGSGCSAELIWDFVLASPTTDVPGVESTSWSRLRTIFR